MSIQLKDVSFIYMPGTPYEKEALKNINISIDDGEIVGIIGHTGSGKSTLVQHLNGLLKPTAGTVLVDGIEISGKKASTGDISKRVGLVFQYPEYQLFEETVFDDVAFGPRNLGLPESEVELLVKEAIELVGLDYEKIKDRSPFLLSGGQKRRVAIAGVISMKPNTLVLDEPTAGLDPAGRKEIMKLIQDYHQQQGKAVIWISHNMDEVAQLAPRQIVMFQGTIFMDGKTHAVFAREQELREIGLDIPAAASIVRRLKGLGKDVSGQAITVDEAYQEITQWLGRY